MSKRASVKITPVYKEDGSEYDLFLTLQEYQTTEGTEWQWHLPSNFGYGGNKAGRFFRDGANFSNILCCDNEGIDTKMVIQGVVVRGWDQFPFTVDDQTNGLSGTLAVKAPNDYLAVGSYSWKVYSVGG